MLSSVAGEEDWLRDADDNAALAPTRESPPVARATGGFRSLQTPSAASPHTRHMVLFCTWQI